MKHIIALGELLIDFIQEGQSSKNNPIYEANPGGAPSNVLAMLNKLGLKTYFIGKVGNDTFGKQLEDTLVNIGVDTSALIKSDFYPTTLAFVHHDESGDRSFTFYRKNGADAFISESEVNQTVFEDKDVFHFGTLSMTNETCKKATFKAIKQAKKNRMILSFDPNLRENLWEDEKKAREAFDAGLKVCNILKIADNELQWFTKINDLDLAISNLREKYNIDLIFLTLGKNGSKAYYKDIKVKANTFLDVKCVDTTGAGDSFMGSALYKVLNFGLDNLDEIKLKDTLIFANAAASLVASKKGVINSLPTVDEILALKNKS